MTKSVFDYISLDSSSNTVSFHLVTFCRMPLITKYHKFVIVEWKKNSCSIHIWHIRKHYIDTIISTASIFIIIFIVSIERRQQLNWFLLVLWILNFDERKTLIAWHGTHDETNCDGVIRENRFICLVLSWKSDKLLITLSTVRSNSYSDVNLQL